MPKYGVRSNANLETCDERLKLVGHEVIRFVDHSVIEGHRTDEKQMEYFLDGKSELDGINDKSNHQYDPSRAFDLLPYPAVLNGINIWGDYHRFTMFAGFVLAIGRANGIVLTSGIDWNRDWSMADTGFFDYPHFELVGET